MNRELYYSNLISTNVRNKIYEIFYVGVTSYNELLNDNPKIVESNFFGNIKTRLLTFLIFRQYESDMLGSEFPLNIEIKKVNNFGYNTLTLTNNSYRVSLSKTAKSFKLPGRSKYRINECSNNFLDNIQLRFKLDDESGKIEDCPKYFIIGFNVRDKVLSHLNLLMPNSAMDGTIININLLEEYNNWIFSIKDEPVVEKQIVAMKSEALKLVNNER